jgi:hypothetical protein
MGKIGWPGIRLGDFPKTTTWVRFEFQFLATVAFVIGEHLRDQLSIIYVFYRQFKDGLFPVFGKQDLDQ